MNRIPNRSDIDDRITHLTRELHITTVTGQNTKESSHANAVLAMIEHQALASNAGGKRLRALLALTAFDAVSNARTDNQPSRANMSAMLDLACAIEIYQTSALVHDDIIDDADMRRGLPSAHIALGNDIADMAAGKGLALMLGNILATASADIANRASLLLADGNALMQTFLAMQHAVEIGQIMDISLEKTPLDDPRRLSQAAMRVFRWKTASYTTIAPLELGFLAAGRQKTQAHDDAIHIGLPLGVAFQLADDLIDITETAATSGKPMGGDIIEGKRTVILSDALAETHGAERQRLIEIYTSPKRNALDVADAIALFHSSGAVTCSYHRIESLWAETSAAIDGLAADNAGKEELRTICSRFIPTLSH
jgi:geranylgeranyl diphosphate synthase type I